jgi:hypothetical protein
VSYAGCAPPGPVASKASHRPRKGVPVSLSVPPAGLSRARSALQDSTASTLYRAPLLLVEILILPSALHVSNCKPAVGHSLWLCLRHSASITSSIWGVLSIQSQAHSGSLVRYMSMSSASDYRPTMVPLFCICPCPQHWTAGPLWVSLLYSVYLLCSRHQTTSPLRATCPLYCRVCPYYLRSTMDCKPTGHLL